MSAYSLAHHARRLACEESAPGTNIEDATWFAASVLHDLWLMPTCLLLEAGPPPKENA